MQQDAQVTQNQQMVFKPRSGLVLAPKTSEASLITSGEQFQANYCEEFPK